MEQARRTRPHFERVLIVVGAQNAGKSTTLRSMYVDERFGTKGKIPTKSRLPLIKFSRERGVHIRCTSPHERGETDAKFFKLLDRAMERAWFEENCWRFNFACPMQLDETTKTSDAIALCSKIREQFFPERMRFVVLHPRQDGQEGALLSSERFRALFKIGCEVVQINSIRQDDNSPSTNGRLLADFFDFT